MKINWFSPLPPAPTDIAHYTMRILPELSSAGHVVLWTDQSVWEPKLQEYAEVKHYDPHKILPGLLDAADITVYHIGNNVEFHGSIWEMSKAAPGTVVLHDQSVHEFVTQYFLNKQNGKNEYYSIVEKYYGKSGFQAIKELETGLVSIDYIAEYYPLTDYILENALNVFIHTRHGFDLLSKENKWPVGYAPLPYRASAILPESADRKYHDGSPYKLIIFGYLGNNRRVNSILQALYELPDNNRVRLEIFGRIFDLRGVKEKIRSLGLQKLVKIHGYVPEKDLNYALDSAHLAINLRYPSRGEASGSQLRIWDHALPSLVTKTKWYATLPPDAVKFVSPGNDEIWDLKVLLEEFLRSPKAYAAMGKIGREILVKEHQPSAYVKSLIDFCQGGRGWPSQKLYSYCVSRVADEVALWEDEHGDLMHRQHVADAIHKILT